MHLLPAFIYITHSRIFSNCQKVINYANIVLGTNASQYLRDWAALGALSPNKNIQPNAYVDADNRANLLVISAAFILAIGFRSGLCQL